MSKETGQDPRWPPDNARRIAHGIALTLVHVLLFPVMFFGVGPHVGFDKKDLFQGSKLFWQVIGAS